MAAYTTIDDSEAYFQCKLYTGNNTGQSITFDGDTDMQPNMIWNKSRSNTEAHNMWDSVRGVEKYLTVNDGSSESDSGSTGVSSFDSDGFTVGSLDSMNDGSVTYVVWCWKETADAGFDIVSYTGNDTADREVGHSLSATPHFIIVKNRSDSSTEWFVYHQNLTDTYNIKLSENEAQFGGSYIFDVSSSIFTLRDHNVVNGNTDAMIAYCFAEKQGFSKFGTYAGNGNADGAFIYTGFKPAVVIMKCSSDSATPWLIWDNKRPGYNVTNLRIRPDVNNAEDTSTADPIDLLSNGFKCRGSNDDSNKSGSTYIYAAFAESPFVNSNGVPNNAG